MRFSLRVVPTVLLAVSLAASLWAGPVAAKSRIKDIVSFEGVRGNHLVGYGLVIGLAGTGDSLRNNPETQQSLTSMMERLGVNTHGATMEQSYDQGMRMLPGDDEAVVRKSREYSKRKMPA